MYYCIFFNSENNNTYHEDSTNSSYYMQTPAITIDVNSFTDNIVSNDVTCTCTYMYMYLLLIHHTIYCIAGKFGGAKFRQIAKFW